MHDLTKLVCLFLCSPESVSYRFGPGSGLITYRFPDGKYPKTTYDELAIGFITQETDAVLLRIDSATSEMDYMEVELVCCFLQRGKMLIAGARALDCAVLIGLAYIALCLIVPKFDTVYFSTFCQGGYSSIL